MEGFATPLQAWFYRYNVRVVSGAGCVRLLTEYALTCSGTPLAP